MHAQFTVLDTVAPEHRVGLFAAPRTYDAWIRFANATSQSDREKDVRGMSVRVSGVAGQNLTPGESRQDFVLNSHPVMVAANTKDFLELLKAMDAGGCVKRVTFCRTHDRPLSDSRHDNSQPVTWISRTGAQRLTCSVLAAP